MSDKRNKVGLVGYPDDKGVENNNGRPGAKEGPQAFRQRFFKLGGTHPVNEMVEDTGDVQVERENITGNHERAIEQVKECQKQYDFSLIIGGGHDYAYPHLRGIRDHYGDHFRLGCINIDAHFDLRPDHDAILSGSPFYMALDRKVLTGPQFVEFGIHYYCNSQSLWEYAHTNQVNVVPFDQLRNGKAVDEFRVSLEELSEVCDGIVISLDLDAVQAASAPGVSAPAPEGFTPSEIMAMIEMSAREEKVASLGIYELNPTYDRDEQTARLASIVAYNFCRLKQNRNNGHPSDQHIWRNMTAT